MHKCCAFSFAISPHFCGKIINQLICSLNISSSYLPTKAYGCADSNANTRVHITKVTIKRHWMCRKTHAKRPGSPSVVRWRRRFRHHQPVLWRLSRPARSGTVPKNRPECEHCSPVFNKPERMRPGRLVTGTARRSHGCTVTAQRRGTSKEPLRQNSETPTLQQLVITARIATLKLHFF